MEESLFHEIVKMKNIIRRGWSERRLEGRLESDAEHSFSMIVLALEMMSKNDLKLDQLKVIKMAAFHEICEIDCGDIIPMDNIDPKVKYEKEFAGIKRISEAYNMPEIRELWLEFEANQTPEAKFVRMLDKYDSVLQSKEYAEEFDRQDVYDEFYTSCKHICDVMDKYKR